jgi:hypothetical protein
MPPVARIPLSVKSLTIDGERREFARAVLNVILPGRSQKEVLAFIVDTGSTFPLLPVARAEKADVEMPTGPGIEVRIHTAAGESTQRR